MKRFVTLMLAFILLFSMPMTVFATQGEGSITQGKQDGVSSADAYAALREACTKGSYGTLNYTDHQYKLSGGGYALYTEISGAGGQEGFVVPSQLENLTSASKQQFLKDMLTIANAMAYDTENGNTLGGGVTTETIDDMLRELQNKAGMGSQLLATLLSETKPDYATANRMYQPFSGVVGTVIALFAILTMALLGVTMAMDIAYITIPAFQMVCGDGEGGGQGGQGGKKGGVGGFISAEAKRAVKQAEGGSGGQSSDGDYKAAVGIYLKYRWKGLTLLGLCLLYLVQGQIYNFVAWFIDLFSGFLGF